MTTLVTMGASLQCTFGTAPTTLIVTSNFIVKAPFLMAATIMDYAPIVNIPTFAMCLSTANPAVIAATSAALGVFTPAPCVPATASPWSPGSTFTKIGGLKALNQTSICNCSYGGVISITSAGQTAVTAP